MVGDDTRMIAGNKPITPQILSVKCAATRPTEKRDTLAPMCIHMK